MSARFPRPGQQPKKSNYTKLLIIISFSVGLLGGYLILGSPRRQELSSGSTATQVVIGGSSNAGSSTGSSVRTTNRRELFTPSMAAKSSGAIGSLLNMALGRGDAQKEALKKTMMAQQSSHDEHQGAQRPAQLNAMKEQMSDKSEHTAASTTKSLVTELATKGGAATQQATATTSGASSTTSAAATTTAAVGSGNTESLPGSNPAWKYGITPVPEKMKENTIHTLFTSNGSPYQNIQARIMVGTWNLARKMPGGERLVAMTRVMHRTTPDEMMGEIETFIAQPLQPECDRWCWFPVADRANAMQQWLTAAAKNTSMIKAPWLLLLESDYVWVKPLPDPGNAYDYNNVPGWSFAYDYIGTHNPIIANLLKEKCPTCDPSQTPNSGPAPVLARFNDFVAATPLWEELSKWIETHEEAKKQLGWVREMYAWDIGVAANRLNIRNEGPPATPLISQPPHDTKINNASMYHYTWGAIFKENDKEIWMFDKRKYTEFNDQMKVPIIPLPPPWRQGIRLQDGIGVSQELHATLSHMLETMNKAIATLPDLRTQPKVA